MARIYEGGSAESRYRKTDLGRAYNPQRAGSEEKAAREWKERVIQDGNIKLNDLQREAEAQSLKNSLERKIQAEGLQLQNLSESIELQMDQQYDKGILEQQLLAEQTQLQVDAQNLQNKQALETAALQAQNQVSSAQLGAISTAIEGILSFNNSVFQYTDQMLKIEEKEKKDEATIKNGAWAFQPAYDPHSPQTAAVVEAENNQTLVEIAEETAISNLDIDPIQQEVLRQNVGYGLSDAKVQNQIGVGQASVQINGLLNEAFNDPNRTVTIRDRTTGQLKTIRPMDATSVELDEALYALGRNLTQELGLQNADRLKASTQYVPALQNAINNLYNRQAAARNAGEKLTRQSQGFTKASLTLQQNGVALAWPEYYAAAATSGVHNGDVVATTKAAVKAFVADATPAQLEQLLAGDIRVYENGPTFAKDKRFQGLIQDAIRDKNSGLITDHRNREKFQEIELSNATNSFQFALMEADSPEATQQAHLAYESQLQKLANAGNAEARLELGVQLNRKNNYNPSNARALRDRILAGETFTKEFLTNQLAEEHIINAEYNDLLKIGLATPEAKQNAFGGKTLYDAANNRVKGIVSQTLITGKGNEYLADGPTEIRTGAVNQLAQDIIRRRDVAVSDYVSRVEISTGSRPDPGDVLNFSDKWLQQNVPALLDGVTVNQNTGTVRGYEYMNQSSSARIGSYASIYIKNPNGSRYVGFDYSEWSTNKLREIAARGVNINYAGDAILNREEKLEAAKAYVAGEPFPPTVVSKATALGVTPQYLVREQARGIGKDLGAYRTQQLPSSFQKMSMSGSGQPTNMYEGAAYLRMMGVPEKGAAYLAGNIQQESSWNGMRDWEGVRNPATGEMDGTSRNGGVVSWASWPDKPARLGRIEAYLGKNISTATHAEQLSAMMWEMQTYYKPAYRVFMNPFATDAQLRRASSEYWGYGYTGDRFVYSQNILQNSTF